MPTPQFYKKEDAVELQYYNSVAPLSDILSGERDDFFEDAYECFVLGEVLYDTNRTPLANAIRRDIFRVSFAAIFESFLAAGSFESYLTVFRKIFGDDVEVDFTVPAPGKLNIDITATGVELTNFVAREIFSDAFVYSPMITQDGVDNIVFQSIKGFTSEYELEQMLFEMVPAGVFTQITLDTP